MTPRTITDLAPSVREPPAAYPGNQLPKRAARQRTATHTGDDRPQSVRNDLFYSIFAAIAQVHYRLVVRTWAGIRTSPATHNSEGDRYAARRVTPTGSTPSPPIDRNLPHRNYCAAPGASWVSPSLTQSACSIRASFPSAANSLEPKRTSPLGSAKSFTNGRYPW